jgi:hypothetical protein
MSKIARYASELGMFSGVCVHEEGRRALVEKLLKHNLELFRRCFPEAEQFLSRYTRIQLVKTRFERITPHSADLLSPDRRIRCVAIRGEDYVASPVKEALELRVQLGEEKLTLTQGSDSITLTLHPRFGALRSIALDPCFPADALFRDCVEASPVPRPQSKRHPFDTVSMQLPPRVVECIADLLQEHYRLHVICTSAAVAPRAVVIEQAKLVQTRKDEDCRDWRTYITATFHASSLQCLCTTCGRTHQDGYARFTLGFCGRNNNRNGKCAVHDSQDNIGRTNCMANMTASLACVHRDGSRGTKLSLPLHKHTVVPLMHALASAAILVADAEAANDDEMQNDVCKVMEDSFGYEAMIPSVTLADDKRALHALHTGLAFRNPKGRLVDRRGDTERWLSELSVTYGYMFPSS